MRAGRSRRGQVDRTASGPTRTATRPSRSARTARWIGTPISASCATAANCLQCHGPDGLGSTYAPSLVDSLKHIDYSDVHGHRRGRQEERIGGAEPGHAGARATNKNVMCYIDAIYVYLRARADGALGRGRPAEARAEARRRSPRPKTSAWADDRAGSHRARTALARGVLPRRAPAGSWPRAAQAPGLGARSSWLIPKVLRVCADPRNLPFSDEAAAGLREQDRGAACARSSASPSPTPITRR